MKLIYIANVRIPTEKAHGIQIMQMCEAFSNHNIEVELVVPQRINPIKENPFSYYKINKNFEITKLPCLDLIFLDRYIGHLGFWIENATFLLSALLYLFFKNSDAIYIRNKLLLPIVVFRRNVFFEIHGLRKHLFIYLLFLKKAKGIITITEKLKKMLTMHKVDEDKILTAPDGVDIKRFNIQYSKIEARKRLNLPPNKNLIIYTGHLYKWKGAQTLVDSSKYLGKKCLIIVVGGTEQDIKKFRIKNKKLRNVLIIGHKFYSEVPYWLKAADVLVLSNSGEEKISKNYTSPLKMFEYMAAQKPIVASDLPSIREILNKQNSILVESDNPEAFAEGIKAVLGDSNLAKKISEQAFQDVQQYTWQKRAKNILGFVFIKV